MFYSIMSSALKHIHLIGVRDVNDPSNVQISTWELSNAFNPQTGSHNARHRVILEGHITQTEEGFCAPGTNRDMKKVSPLLPPDYINR